MSVLAGNPVSVIKALVVCRRYTRTGPWKFVKLGADLKYRYQEKTWLSVNESIKLITAKLYAELLPFPKSKGKKE